LPLKSVSYVSRWAIGLPPPQRLFDCPSNLDCGEIAAESASTQLNVHMPQALIEALQKRIIPGVWSEVRKTPSSDLRAVHS